MKLRQNGATSASKTADSHSAENGQPPKRFVQHQAGHFHRRVVASIFATTAGLLASYAHPAVAGPQEKNPRACGQPRAVPGYLFRGPHRCPIRREMATRNYSGAP